MIAVGGLGHEHHAHAGGNGALQVLEVGGAGAAGRVGRVEDDEPVLETQGRAGGETGALGDTEGTVAIDGAGGRRGQPRAVDLELRAGQTRRVRGLFHQGQRGRGEGGRRGLPQDEAQGLRRAVHGQERPGQARHALFARLEQGRAAQVTRRAATWSPARASDAPTAS